jgi:hypothetical protein
MIIPLKITKKYLGKPWERCNCMELIRRIYGDLGVKLPEEHKGFTTADIPLLLEERPGFTRALLVSACNLIGTRINADDRKRYDLVLIWQSQTKTLFPGVYLGHSRVITSAIVGGVQIVQFGSVNRPVAAWRVL